MNDVKIGTFALVDETHPHQEKMAVVKASEEMGFLVWMNGFTDYHPSDSVSVTVSKCLGEVSLSQLFYVVNLEPNFTGHDDLHCSFNERDRELESQSKEDQRLGKEKLEDEWCQYQYEPVRDACQKLGVTKLWKDTRHGNRNIVYQDLVVMNLTEKGPITIEVQC